MTQKLRAAVIGSGNIGTDLLMKLQRSEWIEPVWMVGVGPASDGLVRAREMGLKTSAKGVEGLLAHVREDDIRIAFDATSAYVLAEDSEKLNALGVLMVGLTPTATGSYCIPAVNLAQYTGKLEMNVNMVTCGGQATIPMVAAISQVQNVTYAEIVTTVSSKSIGPGTRKNIDEFIQTTANAIEQVGGADKGKAMLIVNPAEPPLLMRGTIHCLIEGASDEETIRASVAAMVQQVQGYVPGYRLVNGPVFTGNRVSIYVEVEGLGDDLPQYAGNLDIMTSAALRTAETFAIEVSSQAIALPERPA
ncbi:acetaldehyde dehydrogenase (acetylating) [Celeribacter halophilus]|uniref:acetaldehyde dehydrogenase (acetylating) n=1 Tax=Celeribacter halophilus TaxID=576117 RepID=UPI0026E1FA76|nr:acetaldehyde dehydrogenase (acetylating) [Celeribacter halophilus]MDO6724780.1 acetaldehyde dehydrogenase (acetylating) [Celeribacter halophilus]